MLYFTILCLLLVANFICFRIALFRFFKSRNVNPWLSVVPVYNVIVWLGLVRRSKWWALVLLTASNVVYFLFIGGLRGELAMAYGKKSFWNLLFFVFPGGIYACYITGKYKPV